MAEKLLPEFFEHIQIQLNAKYCVKPMTMPLRKKFWEEIWRCISLVGVCILCWCKLSLHQIVVLDASWQIDVLDTS
eukprot:3704068-Amphidinium_carterae.1